jgi:clan AA aspartic protease (TIGR02281 family)
MGVTLNKVIEFLMRGLFMLKPILLLFIISLPLHAESKVYKCKTPQGDFHYQKSACEQNNEAVGEWSAIAKPARASSQTSLTLLQGQGGHYFVEGFINESSLTFVIDTGATVVALPKSLPAVQSLSCQSYAQMSTANGSIKVCVVTLAKLKFGDFVLENVEAVIMPNLSQALLGMNVLGQFIMQQHDGELTLLKREF